MMEILLVLGGIFILYQSGALSSLGFVPSSGPGGTAQNLSTIISQEEAQAYGATGNNVGGFNQGLATGGAVLGGLSSGAATGGAFGAAAGAVQGVISSIFAGMKVRAQQASLENQALNYAVQAFDLSIKQINAAYNNRSILPQEAIALVQQVFQQFWEVTATKIQPNRNGCGSGAGCPGTALQYESTNGAPGPCPGSSCYCTGNIGAACCVGCGPIRLSVERILQVLQYNGGQSVIAPVIGDRYGLQTRGSYSLTWM